MRSSNNIIRNDWGKMLKFLFFMLCIVSDWHLTKVKQSIKKAGNKLDFFMLCVKIMVTLQQYTHK